jgi:hypothetical protein
MTDDEHEGADGPDDTDSTLVRSGKAALTFTEMTAFVRDLEARPTGRLLDDLPGLMALPEAKHGLVVMVLRRRTQSGGPERSPILERLEELRSRSESPEVRKRVEAFLSRAG